MQCHQPQLVQFGLGLSFRERCALDCVAPNPGRVWKPLEEALHIS
jgi:hypothetical protein